MLKLNLGFLFKKKSNLDKVLRAFKAHPNIASVTAEVSDDKQILSIKFKDGTAVEGYMDK